MATTKTSTLSPLSDTHLVTDKITMSSVEIAELTGKQHKHVKTDIVKLLNELELRHADFSESLKNNQNQSVLVYKLPKRECLILVSGYSIKMRAAIIDRWQALENQQTPIPPTPAPLPERSRREQACLLNFSKHINLWLYLFSSDLRRAK